MQNHFDSQFNLQTLQQRNMSKQPQLDQANNLRAEPQSFSLQVLAFNIIALIISLLETILQTILSFLEIVIQKVTGQEILAEARVFQDSVQEQKINVAIDLDNTLVQVLRQEPRYISKDLQVLPFKFQGVSFYAVKRPYVDDLFNYLQDNKETFNVFLFTSAPQEYADNILQQIDKTNIFQARLYQDDCDKNDAKSTKDLRKVSPDLDRTIIIDDNPQAVQQKGNLLFRQSTMNQAFYFQS